MENVCSELRYLPVTHTLADERALLILCDLSYANSDAVEVAMVTATQTLAGVARSCLSILLFCSQFSLQDFKLLMGEGISVCDVLIDSYRRRRAGFTATHIY